jgi:hypothetical protein
MYDELGDKFEEKLLNVASKFVNTTAETPEYPCTVWRIGKKLILPTTFIPRF